MSDVTHTLYCPPPWDPDIPLVMLHSEAPEIPLHEAPEINHEAPELARTTPTGPDDYSPGHSASTLGRGDKEGRTSKVVQKRKRCGLSPIQFWILLLLVVFLVIGAAIGGALGGIAMQHKQSNSVSPTVDNPGTDTGSAITSSVTGKPSSTRGHTGCPASNGTTYSSHYASKFQILCNKQWSHSLNDVSNPPAADLEQCMEQCALWNAANAPMSTCHVAVYKFIWTQMGRHNCWLKNVSRSAIYPAFKDVTVASGALLSL